MMRLLRIFAAVAATAWLCTAGAAGQTDSPAPTPAQDKPPQAPMSPEMVERLKLLETELRCLVCQNQTLADSPAGLADDLRREIRALAESGKDNKEIKAFLQARYGDFILYKPPVKESTMLLWAGPFALLLLGAIVFVLIVRKRDAAKPESTSNTAGKVDPAKARKLLDDDL
jgi:cytochrome c-type biogenesis protein CcmH